MTIRAPSSASTTRVALLDDDDLCPPALSPYALSILDYNPQDKLATTTATATATATTTTTSTSTSTKRKDYTSSASSQNNTSHTTYSRHSGFLQKLGLGAPRRLTQNQNQNQNQPTTTLLDPNKEPTPTPAATAAANAALNSHDRKHSLHMTPRKYSPLHKRTNILLTASPEQGRRTTSTNNSINNSHTHSIAKNIFEEPRQLDLDHVQSIIDKKKEIAQLKKEIDNYKQQLNERKNNTNNNSSSNNNQSQRLSINNKSYNLLEQIGKGGSSKVFRATPNESPNKFIAIKIVNLNDHESSTIDELKGEIKILHKLRHSNRVVKLLDYSITKQNLYFIMECGDLDLATVLSNRHLLDDYYDLEFIRYHTKEMAKCLDAIHKLEIVHLDLKPANFVFVSGILKLIDFGISNTIQSHTINIYREFQMGTPNYMAPETLIDGGNDPKLPSIWKVGKPADIWSFGCILYQLTYGTTPYASFTGTKKILAITNPRISINYPETAINLRRKDHSSNIKVCLYLQDLTRRCLIRDPTQRINISEILLHPFINPVIVDRTVINEVVRGCVGFGGRHTELKDIALGKSTDPIKDARLDRLVDGVWKRVSNE